MPYPLLLEDSSRISRRHRRREELLECFRLLREGDANKGKLAGTPRLIGYGEQMMSTDERPALQELHGIGNTHQQQEMVPPSQHFEHYSNTNTSFVDTTDTTMRHESKRRRIALAPSIAPKSTSQHDIQSATTTTPQEHKARKRRVTFAPTIATYSTLPQQYEHEDEGDHERKQQRSNAAPAMTSRYMTENDYDPAYSRYPRMRASSLALPDHHFSQNYNARPPFGTVGTFPSGPPFREGSTSQQQPYYTTHLSSDLRQPLYSANPRMYSFSVGRGKPASLLPPHPLGNRAAVVGVPPSAHGTKRRAI
jgi:hypothetical protein